MNISNGGILYNENKTAVFTRIRNGINWIHNQLNLRMLNSARGAINGVAPLDGSGRVPAANLPSMGGGGSGDMVLNQVQTVTALKRFNQGTLVALTGIFNPSVPWQVGGYDVQRNFDVLAHTRFDRLEEITDAIFSPSGINVITPMNNSNNNLQVNSNGWSNWYNAIDYEIIGPFTINGRIMHNLNGSIGQFTTCSDSYLHFRIANISGQNFIEIIQGNFNLISAANKGRMFLESMDLTYNSGHLQRPVRLKIKNWFEPGSLAAETQQ